MYILKNSGSIYLFVVHPPILIMVAYRVLLKVLKQIIITVIIKIMGIRWAAFCHFHATINASKIPSPVLRFSVFPRLTANETIGGLGWGYQQNIQGTVLKVIPPAFFPVQSTVRWLWGTGGVKGKGDESLSQP